jgi:hypothetical protein
VIGEQKSNSPGMRLKTKTLRFEHAIVLGHAILFCDWRTKIKFTRNALKKPKTLRFEHAIVLGHAILFCDWRTKIKFTRNALKNKNFEI